MDPPDEHIRERPTSPITPRRPASTLRRWEASAVTFSLRGRIIATVLFTLPLLWFLYFLIPFGFVGLVSYGVVYPPGHARHLDPIRPTMTTTALSTP